MKTIVVSLFGGPGVGKSALSAELFVKLKIKGVSCEMVQEYVKGWAWEGRAVGPLDQVYILAKQLKAESRLYGKVAVIITDSPLLLSPIYERHYQGTAASEPMAFSILQTAQAHGVDRMNFLLARDTAYRQDGRYETEPMAVEVDTAMKLYLDFHKIPYRLIAAPAIPLSLRAAIIAPLIYNRLASLGMLDVPKPQRQHFIAEPTPQITQ
jgi:nicotinamide riboside kinase